MARRAIRWGSTLLLGAPLLAALAVGACGDDPPAGGAGSGGGTQTGCQAGASRCSDTVVELCSDGAFVAELDCADGDASCAIDSVSGEAGCVDGSACNDGESRCSDATLELCTGGVWQTDALCADSGQLCRDDGASAACVDLTWTHLPVTIDDPVVNGSSLMVPIDSVSFAYDAASDTFVTAFDRDFDQPSDTFFWHLEGASGTHAKKPLSGTVLAAGESFCVGGEDWCQLIGFDPQTSDWVVLGPSSSGMMRVSGSWVSTVVPVSGTQPPDSHINRSHRFAWDARRIFLYGATGPSGFGDTVYSFDLDTASWSAQVTGLDQVDDNCLAYDHQTGTLYSIAGRLTNDGGNTTQTLDSYEAIDLQGGGATTTSLPTEVGPRRAMSCDFDPGRRLLYVFGGAVVNDNWDEAQNAYHNDLWALDVDQGSWTLLMAESDSGTLLPPDNYGDQAFEGHPEGPNFGKNRGHIEYDAAGDRLVIIGAVPIFTHEQIYFLDLDGVEELL